MNNIVIPQPRKFLPKQQQVLNLLKNRKYVLYSGAYGAGKTFLMSHVVIRECIRHPGSLWFFGSQTIPMLRDTVVRTFLEEIDQYQMAINKAREKLSADEKGILDFNITERFLSHTMTFKFWNGSEVLFRSCDEPSKYKSLNLDGFAIDEPVDIDEEVFLMLQGRLRGNHTSHRCAVMAGNPAGRTNWVYRKFFENKDRSYAYVHTTSYDNTYLPTDYIPMMENSYDEDYKRRYLYGEWGSFEGQVYKDFDIDKHVGDFKNYECRYHIAGFDDGVRNPACILIIGVDEDNNMYVKEELYESGLVDSEKAEFMSGFNRRYGIRNVFIDPAALSVSEALKNKKIRVVNADNDIFSGVSKLKSFFKNDVIHIDKSCKNLIKELESYRYEKGRLGKNDPELPVKKDDHACYDDKTEILTDDGWKLFKDLNRTEKVVTMDEYGILEYQKPVDYIEKKYDDYIYKYDGKIDFAVTKNHNMFVMEQYYAKKLKEFKPIKIKISDIEKGEIESYWLPKVAGCETKENSEYIVNPYVLGFYLAEGCKSISKNRKYIHFDNTNLNFIKHIQDIYGGSISENKYDRENICYRLSIRSDYLYDNLPDGICYDKRIPRDFLNNANHEELYDCFIGMVDGDGSVNDDGQITYNSTSEGLINDFQELLIKINKNGTKYLIRDEDLDNNIHKCWRVVVYSDKSNYHQLFKSRIKKEKYNGMVYCVTVPNGNICVRRNGRVIFCGNCDALRYSITNFDPFRKPTFCTGGNW